MTPEEIFKLIEPELQAVEHELARQIESDVHLISQVGRYIRSGGKRVRPALLLLSAKFCDYQGEDAIALGAVVEMIHSATLVHDDVIDEAEIRRGRASVNAVWGNQLPVLMGDWLYASSMKLTISRRNFKILDILVDATKQMIEGELLQLGLNGNIGITEAQHLEISRRKTAHLFSACARIGGVLGDVAAAQEKALADFGFNIGMAFQLIDDLLDFTSSEKVLGKPVISDLKEGKLTLPLIYLMRLGIAKHAQMVETVVRENGFNSVHQDELIDLLREYKTLDQARSKAYEFVEASKQNLRIFKNTPLKQALLSIPNFIVERDR
ncbi:MAG: polyprenyl synthetase family protein [Acidobacteria bacterium]|nr:polyprenyl synthetase family protein [Acidobacteriota bacterium]MBI3658470.1 polyprenyl synthetase family protein [Acidobacteriota bacterium]